MIATIAAGATALPMRAAACVDALREPRRLLRDPARHRRGRGRERRAFAEAEQHTCDQHRDQPAGHAGQHGRGGPDDAAGDQVRRAPNRSLTQRR